MKHSIMINSLRSTLKLPCEALENVVNQRYRKDKYRVRLSGIEQSRLLSDFETVATCTMTTRINGYLQIGYSAGNASRTIEVPMSTSFLVTFIRGKDAQYKVGLCSSLS